MQDKQHNFTIPQNSPVGTDKPFLLSTGPAPSLLVPGNITKAIAISDFHEIHQSHEINTSLSNHQCVVG